MKFTFQKKIYGYECDIYGHLNNANYLHQLEAARSEAMIEIQLPIAKMLEQGIQFFVHRVEMDFIKAIDLEETITVKSWYSAMNRLKGHWTQEIYNSRGELCFRAALIIVFAGGGKARRLPHDIYDILCQYLEPMPV